MPTVLREDGSSVVTLYTNGVRKSVILYDSTPSQIGSTTFSYDAHGRLAAETDARNGATSYGYNNADEATTNTTPSPGGGLAALTTLMRYNTMSQATNVVYPDGGSVTNLFEPDGDVQQTSGSRVYPVAYTYDAQGRKKTMTTWTNFASSSGAAVTTWNYDIYRGWLTNKTYADGKGTGYGRTAAGRLASRYWARGTNTTYSYNAAGNLTNTAYSSGTASVATVYDRRGRQTAITNGAAVTTLTLNDAGETLQETNAGGVLGGLAVSNTFDSLLRRTNLAVMSNTTVLARITNSYDAASRLLTVSDGTNSATYSYLANSPLVDHVTFKSNSVTVMTTSNKFDYLNRLTAISSVASAQSVVNFQYAYNSANQRISVTNVDNSYWLYGYDSLGQVTNGVKKWGDNTVVAGQQFGYGFDTIGNRNMTLAGGDQSGANLRFASYTANNLNQYTSRTVPGAVDVIGSATNTASVWVNQNAAYRKTNYFWQQLTVPNTSGAVYQTVTNLAALTNGNGTNAEFGVTNIGHVFLPQTPESYTYDLDGNTTQDGHFTYGWDAENRLTNMTSLSGAPTASKYKLDFVNDYMGRRIQKIVSTNNGSSYVASYTNKFVYDGWNVVAILDGGNNLLYSFIWGTDLSGSMQGAGGVGGLISMTVYSGANTGTYFYCYDGNGNVAALVNATTGTIAAQYEYGPFGEVIRQSGPMAKLNPFRFSTKYDDDETDLLYYGYRYYNPSTGRWLSRDPMGEQGGLNVYGFVDNDAMDFADYLGLKEKQHTVAASATLGLGLQLSGEIDIDVTKECCLTTVELSATGSAGIGAGYEGHITVFKHKIGFSLDFKGPALKSSLSEKVTIDCAGNVNGNQSITLLRASLDQEAEIGLNVGIAAFEASAQVDLNGGITWVINANRYSLSTWLQWDGSMGGSYEITGGFGKKTKNVIAEGEAEGSGPFSKVIAGPIIVHY